MLSLSKRSLAPLILAVGLLLGLVGSAVVPARTNALSGSEFQAGRIIDDAKFFAASPMSVGDIQTFLNAKVPSCDTWGTKTIYDSDYGDTVTRAVYSQRRGVSTPFTCLKDYQTVLLPKSAESNLCGNISYSGASAAEVIYWVGHSCGINPQVLIVLLQKEQSLITDDWPWPRQYTKATGYGCPDSALGLDVDSNQNGCYDDYEGFFNQVFYAARQFKRYARDSSQFNFRANTNASIRYNPSLSCGSSTVYIQNQATAGLYNYTPYQPNAAALNNLYGSGDSCSAYGNRNFWRMFNDWFGSTFGPPDYSCKNGTNVSGAGTGVRVMPNRPTWGADNLSLTQINATGSACIEVHTWANANFQSWSQHVATNRHAITPADARLVTADTDGDGRDEMIIVEYQNTASGRIEMHTLTSDYQHWASHIASNRPSVNPADSEVIAADGNGDGRDELYLIDYRNTASGMIEIHGWSHNYQQWISHTATNRPAIDPADAEVISADVNGDVKDEFLLIQYRNTSSGFIEVHGWLPGQQAWFTHTATNRPAIDPGTRANPYAEVISADVNGDLVQELHLIQYANNGSGRVEIHTWASGQRQWTRHIATSQGSY